MGDSPRKLSVHWANGKCIDRRRQRGTSLRVAGLERLEGRATPAVVSWDGGGGDFDWNNALNWDTDTLPSAADDVVINVAGAITISHSGSINDILSLTCDESLMVSGGELNIANAATIGGQLTMSGGKLGAGAGLDVAGLTSWQAGTVGGIGQFNANGGVAWSTGAFKVLTGLQLNLVVGGTWNGGDIAMDEGAILEIPAGQTLSQQSNSSLIRLTNIGTATVQVLGTFSKTTAVGQSGIGADVALVNDGLIAVDSGTLSLSGTGVHSGTVTLASGTFLKFEGGAQNFLATSGIVGAGGMQVAGGYATIGGAFAATGPVQISSGTAEFNVDVTLSSLTMTNGEIEGIGDITVTGAMSWSGGNIGGSGQLIVSGGGSIFSTPTKRLIGRTLVISSNTTWSGGDIAMDEGAILDIPSGSTFNPTSGNSITRQSGIGSASVQVNGTFRRSTGGGTTNVASGVGFSNAGLVEVQTGTLILPSGGNHTGTFTVSPGATLEFSGGNHDLGPLSSVNGGGNFVVSGGVTTVNGTFTIASTRVSFGELAIDVNVSIASLTVNGSGILSGTGTINVSGTTTFTGGFIQGTGPLNANGGLALDTQSSPTLRNRTLTLGGNSVWTGTSFLAIADGAAIVINAGAVLDAQSSASLQVSNGFPPANVVNNGTIRKSAGAGFTQIQAGITFDNAGLVEVLAGSMLIFAGGTHTGTFTAATGRTLEFRAGTHVFTPASLLSGGGSIHFTGASATISGTYAATGAATISNGVIFNAAVAFTSLTLSSGGAQFNATTTANSLIIGGDISGTGSLTVSGLTTWDAGAIFGAGAVNFDGGLALNTQSSPGLKNRTVTLGANSTWVGSGLFAMADNAQFVIGAGVVFAAQSNASFVIANGLPPAAVINHGTFRKSPAVGTTAFGMPFTNNGTVEVLTGTVDFSGGLTNFAGSALTGGAYLLTGILQWPGANITTNEAAIMLVGPGSAIRNSFNAANGLANFATNAAAGSFTLSGGRNFASVGTFSNAGSVVVNAGSTFSTTAGDYVQTAGSTMVHGTLDPFGSLLLQGGTLSGSGNVAGPIVVSGSGSIAPGSSPGLLNVNGNLTLGSGTSFNVELDGAAVGTQYDQVIVAGSVNVGGATLNVTRGFIPNDGDSFVIVDNDGADAVVGTFAGLAQGATLNVAGVAFTISYVGGSGNDIVLTKSSGDSTAPTIVALHFDGTVWSPAFRIAAGDGVYGYPAQTAATQLRSMPWSTVNAIYVKFSEDVNVDSGDLGIRGLNVANYTVGSFSYDNVNFVAKWVLTTPFDTDRVILDLDGDGAAGVAVADLAGNRLAGSWSEGVSTFPTTGSAAQDFKFRFVVAVGDVDRNGIVRNADLNLVRNQLFVDAGAGGYNFLADIDGNGLTRNADLNATRNHLFVDPPAGPGPFNGHNRGREPNGGRRSAAGAAVQHRGESAIRAVDERAQSVLRRIAAIERDAILDALFADAAF